MSNPGRDWRPKAAKAAAHVERARLAAALFEQSCEGIVIADGAGNIVAVNPAFTTITGYSEVEALGRNPRMLASGRHDIEFYRQMWASITASGHWQGEIWNRRKDGDIYAEWLSITRVVNDAGAVSNYFGIFTDITERKRADEQIQRLAHHDPLTGLPNRALLTDRALQALSLAQRTDTSVALMYMDLDHFKLINDALGHRIGDELLVEVAHRLLSAVREHDTVSRLGGDEFVLVLPGTGVDGAAHVAEKVRRLIAEPMFIESHRIAVTTSIGIAIFPSDAGDFEALARAADIAMYRTKHEGRNGYRFFTADMQARSAHLLQVEADLRTALASGQMQLVYQPEIRLADRSVVAVEALLRWEHPRLGRLLPADFVAVAEDSGQMAAIDDWVLRRALSDSREWTRAGLGVPAVVVNLSSEQLRRSHFVQHVDRILGELQMPHAALELELSERAALHDPQLSAGVIAELHRRGMRVRIDDFGAGACVLTSLRDWKIDKLKIARSLVQRIGECADDEALAGAVVAIAREFGIDALAVGVERVGQLQALVRKGVQEAQGSYLAQPMQAGELAIWQRGR